MYYLIGLKSESFIAPPPKKKSPENTVYWVCEGERERDRGVEVCAVGGSVCKHA